MMTGYVMFTLSKSPVQNWIAKGQVMCKHCNVGVIGSFNCSLNWSL